MSQPSAFKWLTGNEDEHPDHVGVSDILTLWTDHDLEAGHTYIQWAFPLKEKSNFSVSVPILTAREIAAIKKSEKAQATLIDLMWRMIEFYDKTNHWLVPYDHNHLRITRIVKSLGLLCPPQYALGFYHFIMWRCTVYSKPCIINAQSVKIWTDAVNDVGYPGLVTAPLVKKEVADILTTGVGDVQSGEMGLKHGAQHNAQHGGEKTEPHPHHSVENVVYLQAVAQEGRL